LAGNGTARFLKCFLNYFLFEKYHIDIFLEDFQRFKYVDIKNIMKKNIILILFN
jgi:hypothetical protein